MKTQIRKILKEQGFVVGTPEWKKEYARIRHKTRNPEYLERRRKKRLASNLPDDKPGEMKYETVDKVCALAKEVREMIKLKTDIVRLRKDIIKDLRR